MLKLVSNKIRCKFCGDIIESFKVHDFKRCRCGKCSIDGGLEYAQRSFETEKPEDTYEDLSTYIDEDGKLVYAKDANKDDIPLKPIRVEIKEISDEPNKDDVVTERDENGKPIAGRYPWKNTPDNYKEPEAEAEEKEAPVINIPKWGRSKYAEKDGRLNEEGKKRFFDQKIDE